MANNGSEHVAVNPWPLILDRLRGRVSPKNYAAWLAPLGFDRVDESGSLHLAAPDASAAHWLNLQFKKVILEAAVDLSLEIKHVVFASSGEALDPPADAPRRVVQKQFDFRERDFRFSPKYTFESFVVGSCNEFAHAAAQAVAANPARSYNPLYIYGGVGMGKTHLMHAIGQQLTVNYPGMRVVYVTSEEFMNEMINSIRYDRMSSFRERFRSTDALLVDDIQILRSKERTQEEFFHTFNTLHNMQKQIVISSDLPPKQVPGLFARLRTRFAWGLMADIQPPDLETKMAILDRKAEELGVQLPQKVRTYLATHLKSSIRELEGVLIRLIAISSVSNSEITLLMAKQALLVMANSDDHPTIPRIIEIVAEHHGLRAAQLREKGNTKSVTLPRHLAMYLSKELTGASLPEIGRAFGGRHHTTVLHAVGKIERLRQDDQEINRTLHNLTDRFN